MPILGLGHDVVDVVAFSEQLGEPGGGMRRLFSARELRQASMRARAKHDGEAVHLAARWAGKEAVLKAWCEALGDGPAPYTLDDFPWAFIEILDDSRGRPQVTLAAPVRQALEASIPSMGGTLPTPAATLIWHISLSHDGPIASAVAILETLEH
ncbi:holo-ACP synthase [Bifidobacterium vansinderenii]|uniref:Holo-[acyl-carrier-protein] synthase n=1 Tax=Bifidobacterium vansinderenii TaxID=1984871 RepID=A0A229VWZ0_9BIFI|nr:holo-ACP synthase [Bifidobacterium vansinderenii]OXN00112.1 4'-phosphopantetheinyl transferase [Bifidobacterium vansinderenii]